MNITERFLNYTQFDTQSAEDSTTVPSTPKQLVFAQFLKEELQHEGLHDVEMDEQGYIYATLPANTDAPVPTIGFISHYDTSPDCSGASGPIPWMAATWASWNTRTSMPPRPRLLFVASASIQAMPRARW